MKKEDILKKGSVEVHVKVSGIRQRHTLKIVREKSAWGMIPYLISELHIPAMELIRLAEELQLPIKCKGTTAFPKGKAAQDFAEIEESKKVDQKPVKRKALRHDAIISDEDAEETEEDKADTGNSDEEETTGKSEIEEKKKETKEEKKTKKEEAELATGAADEEIRESSAKATRDIEIESATVVSEKISTGSQKGPTNGEAKEEEPKKKKVFSSFSEEVLSEGILS